MNNPMKMAILAMLGMAGISGLLLQMKTDPVMESFERDMLRVPTPTSRVLRSDIDEDLLYQTINPIGWTEDDTLHIEDLPPDARSPR